MKTLPNNITSLQDLQASIKLVKLRIKASEADLEKRWDRLPEESLKAAMGAVLPVFISDKMASGTWLIARVIGSFIFGKTENGKQPYWQTLLASAAKKFGLSTILKLILGFVKK